MDTYICYLMYGADGADYCATICKHISIQYTHHSFHKASRYVQTASRNQPVRSTFCRHLRPIAWMEPGRMAAGEGANNSNEDNARTHTHESHMDFKNEATGEFEKNGIQKK